MDCHVDPGVVSHGLHKFVALKEVWDHFTRTNVFPNYTVELPDSRCQACHAKVRDTLGAKFSHALHAGKAPCKDCHATVGHTVTLAALDKAGILKPAATGPPTPGGATPSSAAGHIRVACQRCHDQAKMKCSQCHKPPANHFGSSCATCHRVGVPFRNATFRHIGDTGDHSYRSFACVKCHPKGYSSASCTCHGGKPPRGD